MLTRFSLLQVVLIIIWKFPPTLEVVPEIVELVDFLYGSSIISKRRNRLANRPASISHKGWAENLEEILWGTVCWDIIIKLIS
uniref:Uncharacterized protein n=1 Tax=Arundo donax TaxID=35708 RepID=A0A0A9F1K4_ARUDO